MIHSEIYQDVDSRHQRCRLSCPLLDYQELDQCLSHSGCSVVLME